MKKLTRQQLETKLSQMRQAAEQGAADWDTWHKENASKPAVLEFPVGELFNPGLTGAIWAWKILGLIQTAPPRGDFAAHGLEATMRVELPLGDALLAADNLPQYRRLILVG